MSLCHHSLMKVAASYRNFGKQSSILASVNESLVMFVPSHSGFFKIRGNAAFQIVAPVTNASVGDHQLYHVIPKMN